MDKRKFRDEKEGNPAICGNMDGPGSWGIMLREVRQKEKSRCYLINDVWTLSTFSNWMTHITRITASRVHVDNKAVLSPGSSTEKVTRRDHHSHQRTTGSTDVSLDSRRPQMITSKVRVAVFAGRRQINV